MKRPRAKSCKPSRHGAFSLIEVVASLVLLGTLLVGILSAHRRHAGQVRGARSRLAAVAAADRLLGQWRDEGVWGASQSTGSVTGRTDMIWRWSVVDAPELGRVGAAIGRLEIADTKSQQPLATVEILVADGAVIPSTPQGMSR